MPVKKLELSNIRQRHNLIRLSVAVVALLVIAVYEGVEWTWQVSSPRNLWSTLDAFVLALVGLLAYFSVDRILWAVEERDTLKARLASSEKELNKALQRQNTLLRISQSFLDADDEDEVVELALRLVRELLAIPGASFVPLDEHAQPQDAKSAGEIPINEADTWLEYLASPGVREACADCQNREELTHVCPLLRGAFEDTRGVYCVPLRRGEQDYGVFNLFMPQGGELDEDAQALLKTILDETAVTLESVRMRQRAMASLHQLQILREKTDLNGLLADLLVSLRDTLEADYVLVSLRGDNSQPKKTEISKGIDIPESARHLIDGVLQSVATSKEPVFLENAVGAMASAAGVHAIVAAPLVVQDADGETEQPALGVILAASRRARAFSQRQLSILQMIAGQVSLVVQNVRLVAQLEYKTMIEERMRLAREIHDGLAQTLGFLKLKAAQMRGFLEHGDDKLLREAVETSYEVLSEAYLDARQAIDGLRLTSRESFEGWLHQTADEFREYTGMVVVVCDPEFAASLSPEVQAQLIRIVQEALSNIRKHSGAQKVNITCRLLDEELIMEIQDNGGGFNVEDVPGPSQHGLRGMRERAELIGADLQVISRVSQGTTVSVRLPLEEKESLV